MIHCTEILLEYRFAALGLCMINHLMPTIPNIPKNIALYENNCTQ